MSGKNQVASSASTPHIRNRLTHVSEVQAHSVRLASHLGLNSTLALAIAAGHDMGHVPFGHQGEHWLQEKTGMRITHETLGVVMAQHVERRGSGLNLTRATLDGMYRHSGKNVSDTMTQEAWIVRHADKIAYLFADYNDFMRLGWKVSDELKNLMDWFGHNQRGRTFRTMMALAEESVAAGKVAFDNSEPAQRFSELRSLMYEEYEKVVEQDVSRFLDPIYRMIDQSKQLPAWLGIALLTDYEVCVMAQKRGMLSWRDVMDTGLGEIIKGNEKSALFSIDPMKLDLDW